MSSVAAGADSSGYFTPPTTAWSNFGVAASFEIPIDTDNVIDISSFEYVLEINEEQGVTGFPWSAWCFSQNVDYVDVTGTIAPLGDATVDGTAITGSDAVSVLLTAQPDPTQNGLWITSAGLWGKATSIPASGAIFWVQSGGQLANTYWQCSVGGTQGIFLWQAGGVHALGDLRAPFATPSGFGFVAKCTTAGTSGGSEPSWPSVTGLTVVDGTVTWTMQANSEPIYRIVPLQDPLSLVTGCGEGFAAFGNIWLPVSCAFSGIADCRWD